MTSFLNSFYLQAIRLLNSLFNTASLPYPSYGLDLSLSTFGRFYVFNLTHLFFSFIHCV